MLIIIVIIIVTILAGVGYYMYKKTMSEQPIQYPSEEQIIAPPQGRQYNSSAGFDYPGNDIEFRDVPFSECASICDTLPNCRAYATRNENNSGCWFKNKLGGNIPNINRTTYYIPGPIGRQYNIDNAVDYPGNDIEFRDIPFGECPVVCDSLPNCIAYATRNENNRGCWFKHALGGKVPNNNRTTYFTL